MSEKYNNLRGNKIQEEKERYIEGTRWGWAWTGHMVENAKWNGPTWLYVQFFLFIIMWDPLSLSWCWPSMWSVLWTRCLSIIPNLILDFLLCFQSLLVMRCTFCVLLSFVFIYLHWDVYELLFAQIISSQKFAGECFFI